jgi:linker histone H1 and H5 family
MVPPDGSNDDLPSYEEMIVEALKDFDDPEGSQPKRVFSWMASHYPLQTNFRPSASQALQKAFKRGRLEKSSGGKYRLNAAWEGGNVSLIISITELDLTGCGSDFAPHDPTSTNSHADSFGHA